MNDLKRFTVFALGRLPGDATYGDEVVVARRRRARRPRSLRSTRPSSAAAARRAARSSASSRSGAAAAVSWPMSRRIVISVLEAIRGSTTPSIQTRVRRPSPRSSPVMRSRASAAQMAVSRCAKVQMPDSTDAAPAHVASIASFESVSHSVNGEKAGVAAAARALLVGPAVGVGLPDVAVHAEHASDGFPHGCLPRCTAAAGTGPPRQNVPPNPTQGQAEVPADRSSRLSVRRPGDRSWQLIARLVTCV